MGTRKLSVSEFQATAEPAFIAVFASSNPFGSPFTDRVKHRAILYPTGYVLDKDEFESLGDAARRVGDDHLYVALVEEAGQPHYRTPIEFRLICQFQSAARARSMDQAGCGAFSFHISITVS